MTAQRELNLVVVGINHKTAPVNLRERIAFSANSLEESLSQLYDLSEIQEKVILSTCNRVEIYGRVKELEAGIELLKRFISRYHGIPLSEIDKYLYAYTHEQTISHLFRVSSSLDAMVVGETQILGQVKDAYGKARSLKATGFVLNQLFERAFFVAKKIRNETAIGESAVSISYAAVELAKKIFDTLEEKIVLLIGAGEMSELAARHLFSKGVKTIIVSNRTFDRAVELARELKGDAVRFEHFPEELQRVDIVISSTGAPHLIIKKEEMEKIMHRRKNRPIFLIDIAVPRDIDSGVNEIENVFLYNIDDLKNVIAYNRREREKEARKAEEIIKKEVRQFNLWLDGLEIMPTITALRNRAEEIRLKELDKTLSKIKGLSENERLALDRLSLAIINKILHGPTRYLKGLSESKETHLQLQAIREMFELEKR